LPFSPTNQVTRNPKGYTVGRREFTTPPDETMQQGAAPGSSSLYYSHSDIVSEAPPGALVLGVDERCPNHAMAIGAHILTVQVREEGEETTPGCSRVQAPDGR